MRAHREFSIPSLAAMIPTEPDAHRFPKELGMGSEAPACPNGAEIGETYYMAPRDGSQSRNTRPTKVNGKQSQRRVWKRR